VPKDGITLAEKNIIVFWDPAHPALMKNKTKLKPEVKLGL